MSAEVPADSSATADLLIGQCPNCGYSLRGLPEARCPECGQAVDPAAIAAAALPWERRKTPGTFLATAWRVWHRPRALRFAAAGHHDPKAAVWFGRWCVFLAGLAFALVAIPTADVLLKDGQWQEFTKASNPFFDVSMQGWADLVMPWFAGAWYRAVLPIAVWVGVWGSAIAIRGSLRGGESQLATARRGIARYATALLLPWPIVALDWAVFLAWLPSDDPMPPWLWLLSWVVPALLFVATYWRLVYLSRVLRGNLFLALLAPVMVMLAFALSLVLVPWLCGMAMIVWHSLR